MFIVGNLLATLALLLNSVLTIYTYIVIIAVLISWVQPDPYNPIVRFLYSMTEPVFALVRRILPLPPMGIDISPIIVLIIIHGANFFLTKTLTDIAMRLQQVG
jgi:YggT family protein